MGLDMYLERKRYLSKEQRKKLKCEGLDVSKVNELIEDVMYWRKANAIHKWFVDNVQDGTDDCKEYWVDPEKLKELYDIVCEVLEAKVKPGKLTMVKGHEVAESKLPTTQGCFFGTEEYDEYYYQDLENTKKGLEELFSDENWGRFDYYYQSSW